MFGIITNSCIEPVRDEIQKLNFFQNLALREFGVELHDFDSIRTLNNAVHPEEKAAYQNRKF